MKKFALLFAGQGAQSPGMGASLPANSAAAKKIFDLADSIRPGTSDQCFNSNQEILSQTKNTQPCIYTVDLAAASALAELGLNPAAVAGFSLGEMPAAAFSGIFSPKDGFALTLDRARFMDEAAAQNPGGMAAIMKIDISELEELCLEIGDIWPVNYNSPAQTVVAGGSEPLKLLCEKIKMRRGKAVILPVSGAFHSPYMTPAGEKFRDSLSGVPLNPPQIPIYANATAQIYEETQIPQTLSRQIFSPVLFMQTIQNLHSAGIDAFIEVGPGKTLTGLVSRIIPDAKLYNACEYNEIVEIAEIFS